MQETDRWTWHEDGITYMGSDSIYISIWGQARHIIGQWPFSIEDGTLDRAEGSAVAEGEAEEAGSRVIPINRV
jgi:hypothetical protein